MRAGVAGIGLAVVAGIEESDPGGESRWDVDDVLDGREPHPTQRVGSRMESPPSDNWTESGQTPILSAIV